MTFVCASSHHVDMLLHGGSTMISVRITANVRQRQGRGNACGLVSYDERSDKCST
jgi:hypothetical protein